MVHLCPRLTVIIAVKNVRIFSKLAESLFFLPALSGKISMERYFLSMGSCQRLSVSWRAQGSFFGDHQEKYPESSVSWEGVDGKVS